MIFRAVRIFIAKDTESFFDAMGVDLQKEMMVEINIDEAVVRRLLYFVENGLYDIRTEGGLYTNIKVRSGGGQGRKGTPSTAAIVCEIKARFVAHTAVGEVYEGRNGFRVQVPLKQLCDDESITNTGPLAEVHGTVCAEGSTLASELVVRCPDQAKKNRMITSEFHGKEVVVVRNEVVVLPTGKERAPSDMEEMEEHQYTLGGYDVSAGISHELTDVNTLGFTERAPGGFAHDRRTGTGRGDAWRRRGDPLKCVATRGDAGYGPCKVCRCGLHASAPCPAAFCLTLCAALRRAQKASRVMNYGMADACSRLRSRA